MIANSHMVLTFVNEEQDRLQNILVAAFESESLDVDDLKLIRDLLELFGAEFEEVETHDEETQLH